MTSTSPEHAAASMPSTVVAVQVKAVEELDAGRRSEAMALNMDRAQQNSTSGEGAAIAEE